MNDKPRRLLYKVSEVAEALSISRTRVYSMINAGEIPAIIVGGLKRVPVDILERVIAQKLAAQQPSASDPQAGATAAA